LFDDFDLTHHKHVIYYHYADIFRSTFTALSLVYSRFVFTQIGIVVLNTLILIILVGQNNPFKTKKQHSMFLMNEFLTMMSLYHIICFTEFIPEVETKFMLGYSLNGVLAFAVLINMSVIVGAVLSESVVRFKKFNRKRQIEKAKKEKAKREEFFKRE